MIEKQTHEKTAAAQQSPARKRGTRTDQAAVNPQPDRPAPEPAAAPGAPIDEAPPAAARTLASPVDDNGRPATTSTPAKLKQPKPVHDTFTMPRAEYELIDLLKRRARARGIKLKKSELLRAGILALADMPDAQLFAALSAVPAVKAGRQHAQRAESGSQG